MIEADRHRMEGHSTDESDPIRVTQDLACGERRNYARYRVKGLWRLHDRGRSRPIGEVCDIGLGGLRMQGPEPIPPARRYALWIEVIVDDRQLPRIEVIARCAWHRARPDQQFEAGFEFVEITPSMRKRIAQLIDEFGLSQ